MLSNNSQYVKKILQLKSNFPIEKELAREIAKLIRVREIPTPPTIDYKYTLTNPKAKTASCRYHGQVFHNCTQLDFVACYPSIIEKIEITGYMTAIKYLRSQDEYYKLVSVEITGWLKHFNNPLYLYTLATGKYLLLSLANVSLQSPYLLETDGLITPDNTDITEWQGYQLTNKKVKTFYQLSKTSKVVIYQDGTMETGKIGAEIATLLGLRLANLKGIDKKRIKAFGSYARQTLLHRPVTESSLQRYLASRGLKPGLYTDAFPLFEDFIGNVHYCTNGHSQNLETKPKRNTPGSKTSPYYVAMGSQDVVLVESISNALCLAALGYSSVVAFSAAQVKKAIAKYGKVITHIALDRDKYPQHKKYPYKTVEFSIQQDIKNLDINDVYRIDPNLIISTIQNATAPEIQPITKFEIQSKSNHTNNLSNYDHNKEELLSKCMERPEQPEEQTGNLKFLFPSCPFYNRHSGKHPRQKVAIFLNKDGSINYECFSCGHHLSHDELLHVYKTFGLNLHFGNSKPRAVSQLEQKLRDYEYKPIILPKTGKLLQDIFLEERAAIKAATGAGKTHGKLEYCREILKHYIKSLQDIGLTASKALKIFESDKTQLEVEERDRLLEHLSLLQIMPITIFCTDNLKVEKEYKALCNMSGDWSFLVGKQTGQHYKTVTRYLPIIVTNHSYLIWFGDSSYANSHALELTEHRKLIFDEADKTLEATLITQELEFSIHEDKKDESGYSEILTQCGKYLRGGCAACHMLRENSYKVIKLSQSGNCWKYKFPVGQTSEFKGIQQNDLAGFTQFLDTTLYYKELDQIGCTDWDENLLASSLMGDHNESNLAKINSLAKTWEQGRDTKLKYMYRPKIFYYAIHDRKTGKQVSRQEARQYESKELARPSALPCYTQYATGYSSLPAAIIKRAGSVIFLSATYSRRQIRLLRELYGVEVQELPNLAKVKFTPKVSYLYRKMRFRSLENLVDSLPTSHHSIIVLKTKKEANRFYNSIKGDKRKYKVADVHETLYNPMLKHVTDDSRHLIVYAGNPLLYGSNMPELNTIIIDCLALKPLFTFLSSINKAESNTESALADTLHSMISQIAGRAFRTLLEIPEAGQIQDSKDLHIILHNTPYKFLQDWQPDKAITYKCERNKFESVPDLIYYIKTGKIKKAVKKRVRKKEKKVAKVVSKEQQVIDMAKSGQSWSDTQRSLHLSRETKLVRKKLKIVYKQTTLFPE